MKLKVQCPKCKKVHHAPATMAGQRCKCTSCQAVVTVPQAQAPAGKLKVQCRNCKTVHTVPESMRGRRCKCTQCQAVVSVPQSPAPSPAPQSAPGFALDGSISDDLFGELDDVDFNAGDFQQPPPPIQPQPAPYSEPSQQNYHEEDQGDYGRTWEDRIYYDSNVLGLAALRWIEIVVLGITSILAPAFIFVAAGHPNAYVAGALPCLFVWIFMMVFYSGSFGNEFYGRGIIGLVIMIVSYEGPWTFYLWVLLFPIYAAALCFMGFAMSQGLA